MGPQSNVNSDLLERGNLVTDMHTGRMPCEDEGRDQCNATNQGTAKITQNHQKLVGRAKEHILLTSVQINQPF